MAATISGGQLISATSYKCPNGVTYNYNQWSTFVENDFTGVGAGNQRPFVISPHIMATASHYDNIPTGNLQIDNVTVNRVSHENLLDWALDTGFWSESYLTSLGISDIELVKLDKSVAVPEANIPYFISYDKLKARIYSGNLQYIVGWTSPQIAFNGVKYAAPILFSGYNSDNELKWATPAQLSSNIPETYRTDILTAGNTYLGTTGDSGRPVYIVIDGKIVVVSHNHSVVVPIGGEPPYNMTGPDYVAAYPVLKEYIKQYEGEDVLKTL